MAIEPYTNEVAYPDRPGQRDLSMPRVDGVIDLRETVDKIAKTFEPEIKKKNIEKGEADAVRLVGKDENGNYVRSKLTRSHGRDYTEAFEKASGNLHQLEILARTEEAFNEFVRDPQLKRDPALLKRTMDGYREGILKTVGPDIAIAVDELIRREGSQRLLTISERVEREENMRISQGLENKYEGLIANRDALLKHYDSNNPDPSIRAQLDVLAPQILEVEGNLKSLLQYQPQFFEGDGLKLKAKLVGQEVSRRAETFRAQSGLSLTAIKDVEVLKQVEMVLGGRDVPGAEKIEIAGIGPLTVANVKLAVTDPEVVRLLHSDVVRELGDRATEAERIQTAQGVEDKEAEERLARIEGANNVRAGQLITGEQHNAATSEWNKQYGIISPDGQQLSEPRINQLMTTDEGQNAARGFFETWRVLPHTALNWIKGAFLNQDPQVILGGASFINKLRESYDRTNQSQIGLTMVNSLPADVKQDYEMVTMMTRMGRDPDDIKMILSKLHNGEKIPYNLFQTQATNAELDWKKMHAQGLRGAYPGIIPANIPYQLAQEYQHALNLAVFANTPLDQVPKRAADMVRSAWQLDDRFSARIGPTRFVQEKFTSWELDSALRLLNPNMPKWMSFQKGTLAIEPRQPGDPRSQSYGIWRIRVRLSDGSLGKHAEVDFDTVAQGIRNYRARVNKANPKPDPIAGAKVYRGQRQAAGTANRLRYSQGEAPPRPKPAKTKPKLTGAARRRAFNQGDDLE